MLFFSCNKDSNKTEPLRDYAEQYAKDLATIEEFMQTHYMDVTNHPGFADDQNVAFTKIPTGGTQVSIWNQTQYPLQFMTVTDEVNDIDYKLYYLQLRQGTGENSKNPCNVDRVLTSYNGKYLYYDTVEETSGLKFTQFEELNNPSSFFNLTGVIRGWNEIFPKFKTGSYTTNPDGTITYNDFGAGVVFIPSGLGYYASGSRGIPAYAPLVFNFKLYEIERTDQDGDGIKSYLEDLNQDGYFRVLDDGVANPDDTDGDEILNFNDVDDDNDNYRTKYEIEDALGNPYSFDAIPDCSGNTTNTTRIKKHLDKNCH
jgi:hypothetical protein